MKKKTASSKIKMMTMPGMSKMSMADIPMPKGKKMEMKAKAKQGKKK